MYTVARGCRQKETEGQTAVQEEKKQKIYSKKTTLLRQNRQAHIVITYSRPPHALAPASTNRLALSACSLSPDGGQGHQSRPCQLQLHVCAFCPSHGTGIPGPLPCRPCLLPVFVLAVLPYRCCLRKPKLGSIGALVRIGQFLREKAT